MLPPYDRISVFVSVFISVSVFVFVFVFVSEGSLEESVRCPLFNYVQAGMRLPPNDITSVFVSVFISVICICICPRRLLGGVSEMSSYVQAG